MAFVYVLVEDANLHLDDDGPSDTWTILGVYTSDLLARKAKRKARDCGYIPGFRYPIHEVEVEGYTQEGNKIYLLARGSDNEEFRADDVEVIGAYTTESQAKEEGTKATEKGERCDVIEMKLNAPPRQDD